MHIRKKDVIDVIGVILICFGILAITLGNTVRVGIWTLAPGAFAAVAALVLWDKEN